MCIAARGVEGGTRTEYRLTHQDARAALAKHTAQRHLRGEVHCAAYGNVLKIAKNVA